MRYQLVNCIMCGRDTRNKYEICTTCNQARRISEHKDRSARSTQVMGGNCIYDVDEDEEDTTYHDYHGDSCRDDL